MALLFRTTSLLLLIAGAAFFLDRPDVAIGFLWGGLLGELNLRLLRWRILRLRPGSQRSLAARLGVAFFLRYLIIIVGIWFGYRVAGADIPATLAGFLLTFCLAVARTVRTREQPRI